MPDMTQEQRQRLATAVRKYGPPAIEIIRRVKELVCEDSPTELSMELLVKDLTAFMREIVESGDFD